MVDPTARSMPPLMMMKVIPIAPSATMTVCAKHDAQVARRQVLRRIVAHQREDADDEDQAQDRGEGGQAGTQIASMGISRIRLQVHSTCCVRRSAVHCAVPIAAAITDSGVQSARGRAGVSWPRLITASESHRPNSSGRYELTITTAQPASAASAMAS